MSYSSIGSLLIVFIFMWNITIKLWECYITLTTFNTEIGRFRYTVMPFVGTVVGDIFQCKLDQCFGMIKQVIVIADDIMIVGKKQNHRDHDVVLTTLLDTARKCHVILNFDKLQYKKTEVGFFGETCTTSGCKPGQSKVSAITGMPAPTCKTKCSHSLEWSIIYQNSQPDCQSLWIQLENFLWIKYLLIGAMNTKKLSREERDC